jgi:hypothetical protein
MSLKLFLTSSFSEKPSIIGWLGGWAGFLGAVTIQEAQVWAAIFAGVMGGISALAATIYTVKRILEKPKD